MSAGQHVLELVSVQRWIESDRSPGLLVLVPSTATTTSAPSNELSSRSALRASTICASEHQADCYDIQVIASDLGRVTALTLLPDGRVMFIEGGRQLRLINRDSGSNAIALVAETARQLTGLAIDERFQTSRSVFVAWTEPAGDAPRLSITRYRELADALGEGATIVTGLPASSDQVTPLALDDGLVYVAVPVDRSRSAPRFLGGAGAVLRFDSDGRVPPINQHGSPIVAEGYPGPLALAIDRSHRRVWLTGRDHAQLGDIATFEIPRLVSGAWPGRPVAVGSFQAGNEGIDSITIFKRAERADSEVRLLVAASGRVRELSLTANGDLNETLEVPLGDGYRAQSVVVADDGALYVSVSTQNGSFSVIRLASQRN
jgi:glucose/arabinose dehydrogenase